MGLLKEGTDCKEGKNRDVNKVLRVCECVCVYVCKEEKTIS